MDIMDLDKKIELINDVTDIKKERLSQLDVDTIDEIISHIIYKGSSVEEAYTTYCENACDMAEVYECEKLINDFHNNNYGTVDESIFDDYNHIPLVTNKDKVSVYADFLGRSINSVYKDRIIKIEQFDTLYDMQAVLKDLDYYKMTNILTENLKDGGLLIVTPDGKKHETLSDYHYNDNIRIFVDMDGTLARFHDEVKYLERMWEEGFFKELKPFEEIVDSIHILKRDNPEAEIFILSAAIEGEPPYCQQQKHEWLDRYLPEIDRSHRIFTEIGKPKADYIEGGISATDILIDDYNKGLEEWEKSGGTAVKCVNNINHKGLVGPLWEGKLIHNDDFPSAIASDICTIANDVGRLWKQKLSKMQDENYRPKALYAEWIAHMDAYRLFEPEKPQKTIAYDDRNIDEINRDLIDRGYDGGVIEVDDFDDYRKSRE